MHKILGVIIAAAFVTGCGASGQATNATAAPEQATVVTVPAPTTTTSTTTTSTTTTSTTTTSTTTTIPPPTPAEKYLEFVTPVNCMRNRLKDGFETVIGDNLTQRDWPGIQTELQPMIQALSDAIIIWMGDLVAYTWPSDVQADVDLLIAGNAQEAHMWASAAEATTFTEYVSALTIDSPDTTATAAVIRVRLGLPTNLNDTQDWCAGQT